MNDSPFKMIIQTMEEASKKNLKGQKSTKKRMLDFDICKASTFKELRGLKDSDIQHVLQKVLDGEIRLGEINCEAKNIKKMKEVQVQFYSCLGEPDWATAKQK